MPDRPRGPDTPARPTAGSWRDPWPWTRTRRRDVGIGTAPRDHGLLPRPVRFPCVAESAQRQPTTSRTRGRRAKPSGAGTRAGEAFPATSSTTGVASGRPRGTPPPAYCHRRRLAHARPASVSAPRPLREQARVPGVVLGHVHWQPRLGRGPSRSVGPETPVSMFGDHSHGD